MEKNKGYPTLEIYHPSISAGDAAIIVSRAEDATIAFIVLIDLGCNADEIIKWCTNIKGFVEDKSSKFDYVIVSHYHTDHYAGLNHKSIVCTNFISSYVSDKDRLDNVNRTYKGSENICSPPNLTSLSKNKSINLFDLLGPIINLYEDEELPDNKALTLDLTPTNSQSLSGIITLKCICANGIYEDENGDFVAHDGDFKDWNDHSIAWLIEYKGTKKTFRYFTAGDLSGDTTGKYTDIETQLLPFLKGKQVNVLKATHHGSKHSLTYKFLETIKPENIIVPCNNGHLLPFPQFFNRVQQLADNEIINSNIYITNYVDFELKAYKKKGKGYDAFTKLNKSQIKTKITDDSKSIFISKKDDDTLLADLPVYQVSVDSIGSYQIKQLSDIKIKITAPSHGEQNLPELWGEDKDEFAVKVFEVVKIFDEGTQKLSFFDAYELNEKDKVYVENKNLNSEMKARLLSSFRKSFASSKFSKTKSINSTFLQNPRKYAGKSNRKNTNQSLNYLNERKGGIHEQKIKNQKKLNMAFNALENVIMNLK